MWSLQVFVAHAEGLDNVSEDAGLLMYGLSDERYETPDHQSVLVRPTTLYS